LPPGRLSADQILDRHTLLPYYAPFRSPEVVEDARRRMLTSVGGVHAKLGLAQSGMPDARPFRYCPIHPAEDRANPLIGRAYWRRLHQTPGVRVCPEHLVFLEQCTGSEMYARDRFVPAEEVIPDWLPDARPLNPSDATDSALLFIAVSSRDLLARPAHGIAPEVRLDRYRAIFHERGYLLRTGVLKYSRLRDDFRARYSDELLGLLACPLGGYEDWFGRLTRGVAPHIPFSIYCSCTCSTSPSPTSSISRPPACFR
jgi:hypothetical protein